MATYVNDLRLKEITTGDEIRNMGHQYKYEPRAYW